jgi:hypothetical protein
MLSTDTILGWLKRFRRKPHAVLWGGRECDRWIGSPEDLRLAELERTHARREAAALAKLARQLVADAGRAGMPASEALKRLQAMGAAIDEQANRP